MNTGSLAALLIRGIPIALILTFDFVGSVTGAASGTPEILYVAEVGPVSGNGLSWSTAMRDLQDALQLATGGSVREIRVAKGTYRPDRGSGNRDATFQLINNVEIKGGYAGPGASDPNVRDPRALKTVLSGNIGASSQTDNSNHVVTGTGTNRTAILDGFTIIHGYSDWAGAGVLVNSGGPTIRKCVISQNQTKPGFIGPGGPGAGIYSQGQSLIQDCVIEDNVVGYTDNGDPDGVRGASGGGMLLSGGNIVEGCIIRRNRAGSGANGWCAWGACNDPGPGGDGGGVYATSAEIIRNCLIEGNRSGVGGSSGGCSPCPSPCCGTCPNVRASWGKGGGVYGNPVIENCTIVNNLAADQLGGVGVYGAAPISNSIIWGNGTNPVSQVTPNAIIDHSAIQGWSGGPLNGNIGSDPLFVTGPLGDFYLSQTAAGQPVTSPCVDAGNDSAANLGLDQLVTRKDNAADSSLVDMGFHYPVQCTVDSDCLQDGDYCNGTEYCHAGACLSTGNPCGGEECCDESLSKCFGEVLSGTPVLFVAQREGDRVSRFHGQTGEVLPTPVPTGHGGVDYANGIALSGYDGSLWVASANTRSIEKFRPGNVVCAYDHIGSVSYYNPLAISGLVYGPNGYFYFSDYENDRLGQVQGPGLNVLTGCGLDGPTGLTFLNSNTLLAASEKNDTVVAFNTDTRTCSVFAQGCGLDVPVGIAVAPDGSVLVASYATDSVIKFGPAGQCLGAFVTPGSCGLDGPQGIAFGPNGNLFVSSLNTDQVLEYSGASGLPIDRNLSQSGIQCQFSPPGQLDGPTYLLWTRFADCDHNGIDDAIDVQLDDTTDCDKNNIFDPCQIEQNPDLDADSNGILDICQLDPDQTSRFVDVAACPRAGTGRDHDPFCSIQHAIDMAEDGHEVVVRPGSYNEEINFKGKAIVVRSAEGPSQTTIGQCTMNSSETRASVLTGFSITAGGSYSDIGVSLTNSSPTITGCIVNNNRKGIYSVGGAPLIQDCIISNNHSPYLYGNAIHGGGIYVDGPAEIARCTIIDNAATDGIYGGEEGFGGPGGHGGGAYLTGGATIRNSLIASNRAGDGTRDYCSNAPYLSGSGGGIYAGSNVQIIGCTIVWNAFGGTTGTEGFGSGIFSATNTNRVENCIVYANWHQYGRYATQDDVAGVFEAIEHSCITRPLVPGIGNIALPHVNSKPWPKSLLVPEPYFENFYGPDQTGQTADDNFRLSVGSPCANAGAPDFVPLPGETDLDGQPRVKCGRVDMGAYESGSDESACVTFYDLRGVAALMACTTGASLGGDTTCAPFDLNADDFVNALDWTIFVLIYAGE